MIYTKTIPAHPADFADFPDGLHPDIRAYLASHNIPCLYTHQAELFEYFGLREALHPVSAGYAEDERLAMDFLEKMCAFCRRMGDGGYGQSERRFGNRCGGVPGLRAETVSESIR